jgi:hypothetical protein
MTKLEGKLPSSREAIAESVWRRRRAWLRRVPMSLSRAAVKTDLLRVVDYGQVRVVSRGPADKM